MKTKQPELNKITALYERLSREDEQSGHKAPAVMKRRTKTVILQESTPMHRTITPAPLTVKQRTK